MVPFLKTDEFKNLNVGFALDEGATSTYDKLYLIWAERAAWRKSYQQFSKNQKS